MTTLSEIDQEKNFIKAGILEHHWWGERRLPVVCNRREVMLYIERLEVRLSEAEKVVKDLANGVACVLRFNGCSEEYITARLKQAHDLLAQHERGEAR